MRSPVERLGYVLMGLFSIGVIYESLSRSTFVILVPIAVSLVLLLYMKRPAMRRLVHRRFVVVWIIILLATRFGFFAMYLGYGRVTWDLTDVFYLQGRSVLEGKMPNIGFPTHYNQYFPFLLAIPVALANNPYSIVAFFMAFDIMVGLGVWSLASKIAENLPPSSIPEDLPKTSVMLYILCPASFYVTIYWNQQEVVTAFLLLLVVYAYLAWERRPDRLLVAVPLVMAGAFVLSYLLVCIGLFAVLTLFYDAELKRKLIVRSGAAILALYMPFLLLGVDFKPVLEEFGYGAIGNNPFAILETFSLSAGPLPYVLLVVAFALVYFAVTIGRRGYESSGLTAISIVLLAYLLFMTLSRKSVSFYVLVFLPFLAVFVAANQKLGDLYLIYGLANSFASHFGDRPNINALARLLPVEPDAAMAIVLAFMVAFILMVVAIQLAFIRELIRPYRSALFRLRLSGVLRFYADQLRSLFRRCGTPARSEDGKNGSAFDSQWLFRKRN